jgi:hypothetical protein
MKNPDRKVWVFCWAKIVLKEEQNVLYAIDFLIRKSAYFLPESFAQ